ncbi:MAG: hypothetical protein JO165_13165 [Candidatus Eremiobacteraeota bacterium]|nr:hypothetical protein [Candidatus Eremiobacteraeota bacterium]
MTSTRSEMPWPAPDIRLDWLAAIAAIWIMAGTFADGHEHVYESVETFFNPYHAVIYSGGLFAFAVFIVTALRNVRRGYTVRQAVPKAYSYWLFGATLFLLSGIGDLTWHRIFGFEGGVDILLSPPHIGLLTSGALLGLGPVRSAIETQPRTFVQQLPAVLGLGAMIATVQFATQYAFYPETFAHDAPLSPATHSEDQVVLYTLTHYRVTSGLLIFHWQTILLVAPALFLLARIRVAFGGLAVLAILVKVFAAGEQSRNILEFIVVVGAAAIAGLAGDAIQKRCRDHISSALLLRLTACAIGVLFAAAYFVLAAMLVGGTWWNQNLVYGIIVQSGLLALLMSNLAAPPKLQSA